MFIKFGDQSPVIEVKNAKEVCPDCRKSVAIINGRKTCHCNKANSNSVETAIDFLTQKSENGNK